MDRARRTVVCPHCNKFIDPNDAPVRDLPEQEHDVYERIVDLVEYLIDTDALSNTSYIRLDWEHVSVSDQRGMYDVGITINRRY